MTADRALFEEIFERYHRSVLAYCARRSSTVADAEDATAESFAIAWRRRDVAPAPDAALPWLYAIARRTLANQRRGNDRRGRLTVRLDMATSLPTTFGEAAGWAVAALDRLRPDDQEILRLVAWEELRYDEIAQVLGITTNAVAIRVHRARIRFEEELRMGSGADAVKGIEGRRTPSRMKGRMIGLLHREPSK